MKQNRGVVICGNIVREDFQNIVSYNGNKVVSYDEVCAFIKNIKFTKGHNSTKASASNPSKPK